MTYEEFIAAKAVRPKAQGITKSLKLRTMLKPFQRDVVKWALAQGRGAIFAGTGLGKTIQQLSWAQAVARHTKRRVLIMTPLADSLSVQPMTEMQCKAIAGKVARRRVSRRTLYNEK